jgi:predicted ATPase
LGIEEIAGRLDERFQLLTGGRRTALPRHQTLQATFDWSYALLSEPERVLLRRLGIFAGSFSLEAACAVATDGDLTSAEVIDGLASLVAKSLIAVDGESTIARYRMLHTMRAYALEKLAERGERDRLERRHAEYGRDVMERAESRLERSPTVRQLADLARLIDNVRANLDWAFSPAGDQSLGIALTAGAIPFWMHLSLMDECRGRVEQALAAIESRGMHDPVREMKLRAALGTSLLYTTGAPGSEIGAAWSKALALAESLNNAEYQLRSLRGLWSFHIGISPFDMTLHLAERFCSTAAGRPDPNEVLIGERMIGVSQHLHGEQDGARRRIEHMLAGYETTAQKSHVFRFQTDQRVLARVFLARVLWLQGMPKQATQTAERAVEEARATGHINSLCYALALAACPIALWTGDLNAAEHHIATLLDHSARHALPIWHAPALSHQGALAVKRGDVAAGLRLLRAGIDELGESRSALRYIPFVAELAEALGRNGQIPAGLAEAEEALGWTKRTENRWLMPELLRIQGDLFLLQGASDATLAAEDHFRQALDWARRQGALSWELRSATRLARLSYDEGRLGDASALLQPVYDRFTDGFDTADLKAAKALLDALN